MLVKGDVKCLHCGHLSGEWVGRNGAPLTVAGLRGPAAEGQADPESMVRCRRCDGPVFLDDVGLVMSTYRVRRIQRMREQVEAIAVRRQQERAA